MSFDFNLGFPFNKFTYAILVLVIPYATSCSASLVQIFYTAAVWTGIEMNTHDAVDDLRYQHLQ